MVSWQDSYRESAAITIANLIGMDGMERCNESGRFRRCCRRRRRRHSGSSLQTIEAERTDRSFGVAAVGSASLSRRPSPASARRFAPLVNHRHLRLQGRRVKGPCNVCITIRSAGDVLPNVLTYMIGMLSLGCYLVNAPVPNARLVHP